MSPEQGQILALIPARGGSKGIHRKNLQPVAGRPLVVHAIRHCFEITDRVIVSTDDPAIAAISRFAGAEVMGRPDELASDEATVDDVCRWLVHELDWKGYLLVVQPTVPQITGHLLGQFAGDFIESGEAAWVMGTPLRHVLWQRDIPLVSRVNRQVEQDWPLQEIGVRMFAPDCAGQNPEHIWPVLDLMDIDTPADLAAVRSRMESKRILFRVTAGRQVGSGHLHRCLQLAEHLQAHDIGFIPSQCDDWALDMIEWNWPITKLGYADLIINDCLDSTDDLMLHLRQHAPVISLEDSCGQHANLVINDMRGDGPRYAIVRPEFLSVPSFSPEGGRVLVTFGGSDPAGLTEMVEGLFGGLNVRVVPPPGRVGGQWRNLAEDMAWCDLVVTSGGRTVWEAMAARRPVITLLQNARETGHTHLKAEYGVINLGLGVLADHEFVRRTVNRVATNPVLLGDLSARMVGLVDGRGVGRVCWEAERLMGGL